MNLTGTAYRSLPLAHSIYFRYDARGSPYNATFWTDLGASGFGYRARFEPDAKPGRIMMTMIAYAALCDAF